MDVRDHQRARRDGMLNDRDEATGLPGPKLVDDAQAAQIHACAVGRGHDDATRFYLHQTARNAVSASSLSTERT
jgi:hypothetical protein